MSETITQPLKLTDLKDRCLEDIKDDIEEIVKEEYPYDTIDEIIGYYVPVMTVEILELAIFDPSIVYDEAEIDGPPIEQMTENIRTSIRDHVYDWLSDNGYKL